MYGNLIDQLIDALRCLPGVGAKSAQRMALQLLEHDKAGAAHLSAVINEAVDKVGRCEQCRTLTEHAICGICSNSARLSSEVCVVENPADLYAIEQAGSFRGKYFVLLGHLSPIDGIGPAKSLGVAVSRIAYGVPMGGELEYVDGGTLNLALQSRKVI